jgi:ribonuclease HI
LGAQGGDVAKWLDLLAGHTGLPLFNASRSILYAGEATENPPAAASRDLFHDPFGPIREAAERTRSLLLPIADRLLQSGTPAESESDHGSEHELKAETAPAPTPSETRTASASAPKRTPRSSSQLRVFTVYTDGACSGNPGPGGWAALIRHDGRETQISGGEPATTNNRMEMRAVLEALSAISDPAHVRIHSDSALIINAFTQGWIDRWTRNGWRKADRKPVENQGLWQDILRAMAPHRVDWIKVKGHHDDELNNRVDKLAVAESLKFS